MMNRQLIILAVSLCGLLWPVQGNAFSAPRVEKRVKNTPPAVSAGFLSVEQLKSPMGIGVEHPRLSWQIRSSEQEVMQQAYRILVASSPEKLAAGEGDLWDSGRVESSESLWIPYGGQALKSNQRCYWKVKVFTTKGETDWSEPSMWSMGLLSENSWKGRWIGWDMPFPWDSETQWSRLSARYLRKEFSLKKEIRQATLHICGLGMYELFVNGRRVGEQVLAPVPTDYRKTVLYNSFDVTSLLKQEENALGVTLGNGRYYTMRQHFKTYKIVNFGYPKMRLNLIVEYTDGSSETIVSDEKWKLTADGPIRSNNEYDGEEYDATKELGRWTETGYDDSRWEPAQRVAIPMGTLRASMTPDMKVMETVKPLSMKRLGDRLILDMGQNMAGWIRMKVRAAAGDTIRLRFAERLQENGELFVDNLRDARSEDTYIANGREQGAEWAPRFVYHGFRYVEVKGYSQATLEDFQGEVVYDEMETTGTFSCDNSTLNRVIQNAYWGIRDNYKGMPVDCPQRNERQPWLGDRTMGSLGESYLFDNGALYSKWMDDIREAQREDGCIPDVAPAFWAYFTDNMTWPAALPLGCEMLYTQYGNRRPLERNYDAMKRWLAHMQKEYMTDGYVVTRDRYGDWCVPPESLELIHAKDPDLQTDGSLIATAYMAKMLQTLHRFAQVLGKAEDAQQWEEQEKRVKEAFNREFLNVNQNPSLLPGHVLYPDSVFYGNNTVTANILPLAFGLVPDEYRDAVVKNVVATIITKNNGHISCGVIGVQWLLRELSRNGFADVAYLLATNKTYPSWGYMAEQGATTIWELWNGDLASPEMNSGNHVMLLGDLLPWCYENLAGIKSDSRQVGFRHIVMHPNFEIQELSRVDATYRTPYGPVESHWKKNLQQLEWNVVIPANTTAEVHLPDGRVEQIGSGSYRFTSVIPVEHEAVVTDEFLYEDSGFPECHASTIVELKNGDLVAAFFGGTKEKNPDCNIWVCRKPKNAKSWTKPYKAADGIYTEITRSAFSAKDLRQFEVRDSLLALLLKDKEQPTADDRAALYQTVMEQMGGVKEAGVAVPMGNGKVRSWWMDPAPNSGKPLKGDDWRKPCYNPVLYQIPGGDLVLFYKIGLGVSDWTGWQVRSKDGGKTWGRPIALQEGFLGPIKNKPEYVNGRIICPSSTENGGWKFHFEISDDLGKTWKYVGPIETEPVYPAAGQKDDGNRSILCIQPSILKLADGRLMAIGRTRNSQLAVTYSRDNGDSWSKVKLTDLPNNNSGTDAVTTVDGLHVLIYNDFGVPGMPKGPRTPLSLAVSEDGQTWKKLFDLEDSPISQYSYPSIIQGKDGMLHVIYTWRRQRIAYKKIDPRAFR